MIPPVLQYDMLIAAPPSSEPKAHGPGCAEAEARRLVARLHAEGLPDGVAVRVHANRSVVVGYHPRRGLRIHRGYAYASDDIIRAITRFLRPGLRRHERLELQRRFLEFPVHRHVPPERPPRRLRELASPGDIAILERLRDLHSRLNHHRFGDALRPVLFRLSGRMRTRLGEFGIEPESGKGMISISRRHLRRDGWAAVEHTVLHEMVHQWQAETGISLDHGPAFRSKAREVGIDGRAVWRDPGPRVVTD